MELCEQLTTGVRDIFCTRYSYLTHLTELASSLSKSSKHRATEDGAVCYVLKLAQGNDSNCSNRMRLNKLLED